MELKGKKVLVVGLGKSGLSAALFLRARGAQVTVLRHAQRGGAFQGNSRASRCRHQRRVGRPRPPDLSPPGHDCGEPGRSAGYAGAGASARVWTAGDRRPGAGFAVSEGTDPGHHRLERQDDHDRTNRRDPCRRGTQNAGRRHIGVPVVDLVEKSSENTWSVLEVSSFQLESTHRFHPRSR